MAASVFCPGKLCSVTVGAVSYAFKVAKVNASASLGDVRSFLDSGAPHRIAGPYDGSIELTGAFDKANMTGVFAVNGSVTVVTALTGTDSTSVSVSVPCLIQDVTYTGDVEKPVEINIKVMASGSFSVGLFS